MHGTIFIHCQTFSDKSNRGGQCVKQVIGEGIRSGGYHSHVSDPQSPTSIFGDPSTFKKMHDDYVSARKTDVMIKGRAIERAIRFDRHTLFTIIASYPLFAAAVQASPQEQSRYKKWENLTLKWIQGQFKDQLKVAFPHVDEAYPHLHFWLLADNPDADACRLHPGKCAKRETELRLKADGVAPRAAVKAGNRALKEAMRGWIDDYHRAVGGPCGLRRDGPLRRRLSRAQYCAEQSMLAHQHHLDEDRGRLEREIKDLCDTRTSAVQQVEELENRTLEMMDQQEKLAEIAQEYVVRAQKHTAQLQMQAAELRAAAPLLDAIIMEITDRTISFDASIGWRVRDPEPFQRAPHVWKKLSPAILRMLELMRAADDGRGQAERPAHTPQPRRGDEDCRPLDTSEGLAGNGDVHSARSSAETLGKGPVRISPEPAVTETDMVDLTP